MTNEASLQLDQSHDETLKLEATIESIVKAKRYWRYCGFIVSALLLCLFLFACVFHARFLALFLGVSWVFWTFVLFIFMAVLTARKHFTAMMIDHLSKFHTHSIGK